MIPKLKRLLKNRAQSRHAGEKIQLHRISVVLEYNEIQYDTLQWVIIVYRPLGKSTIFSFPSLRRAVYKCKASKGKA